MNDCRSHGPDCTNRSAGSPTDPPAGGVPSAGSWASTQEGLLSGLQPDYPGERHQVVSTFQTVPRRSDSPHLALMWGRKGGWFSAGLGALAPESGPAASGARAACGSGRPLGPPASAPGHQLQASCFVLGKPQLDPRGMRRVPQHKDAARQGRLPRPSGSLPPPPSPRPGPRGPSWGVGGRTTAPAHPPGLRMLHP